MGRAIRLRGAALGVGLAFAIAGCSGAGTSSAPTPIPIPSVVPPVATPAITPGIAGLVADLQDAYARGDWQAVQSKAPDEAASASLLRLLQGMKQEDVVGLRISPMIVKPAGQGRYVVTLQFASDPRALPLYGIYLVQARGDRTTIVGTVTGLDGSTYRNVLWTATRSAHFTIYHSPYQLAGVDRQALAELEYQRRQFIKKFGLKVAPHISYYLYPTTALMSRLTSSTPQVCGTTPDNIGCADPYASPPAIHASVWPTFHEPIHIYQRSMVPPPPAKGVVFEAPLFIGEGMAVALEDREVDPRLSDYCSEVGYTDLDDCARASMPDVDPITLLSDRGFRRAQAGDAYALGGSFVRYLILHGGYRTFGKFYYVLAGRPRDRLIDYDVAARNVYHRPIRSLLAAWEHHLCPHGCH